MTARRTQEVAMKISGILLVVAALFLAPVLASAQAVCGAGELQITACVFPTAYTGEQYSATINTTGCQDSAAGGIGGVGGGGCFVTFDSPELRAINLTLGQTGIGSGNGAISGVPSMAGSFPFVLTATDFYANCSTTCNGTLTVQVPVGSIPPQYLPPGGYTYTGGTTTGTAPGEAYEALGNTVGTYYVPGGADDGDTGDGNSCFVSSAAGGSLYGACALAALTLCGLLFVRRS
jgi:hypothetical protein